MSKIVSNATPLIYLAKTGRINLLKEVFEKVAVPEEVKKEVVDKGKELEEKDAYVVERAINEGWLIVKKAVLVETPIELEEGERAVISLAKKLGIEEVLIDESPARTVAKLLDLKPRGTIFVLLKALERRQIDLDGFVEILKDLVKEGFRLKEEVYLEALKKAREIDRRINERFGDA